MASPAVAATNTSAVTTGGTSHTINLPSGIVSGNLLIIWVGYGGDPGTRTFTGWTEITNSFTSGNGSFISVFYRQADGTEGSTASLTTANTTKSAHTSYRITGHVAPATQAPECPTGATGVSGPNTADPPTVTPTGGSKDYLFLAGVMIEGEDFTGSGAPTNYTNNLVIDTGTAGAVTVNGFIQTAQRQLTASSEDPGVFSHTINDGWVAQTVAIHPAPATQNLAGALFTKAPTFNTGTVTATYNLAGSLFTKAPTFPTGAITATFTVSGTLFTKAPTFPTGTVSLAAGSQNLAGVLFTKAPTFNTGTVSATYALTGILFTKAPTFLQGTVSATYSLTGTLFQKAPTFPTGAVSLVAGSQNLGGVLFQKAPTFPQGAVANSKAISVCIGMSQSAEMFGAALSYLDPTEFFVHWDPGTRLVDMADPADSIWSTPEYRGPNAPLASPTVAYIAVSPAGTVDFDVDTKAMLDNLVDEYPTLTTVHYWLLVGADDHDPGSPGENGFQSCNTHENFQATLESWVASNPTYLTQGTNVVNLTVNLGPEVLVSQPADFEDELGHLAATGKSKAADQFLAYLGLVGSLAQPTVRAVSTFVTAAAGVNLTPTAPAGVAIGDWVEVHIVLRTDTAPAAPANWTLQGVVNTTGVDLAVYSRNGGWQSGDSMPTWSFSGGGGQTAAVSIAYQNVNLGFPYHLAHRLETNNVRYADGGTLTTLTPPASETAVPNLLQVVSVATPDDNSIGLLSGSEQGFTLLAGGTSYQKTGGAASTQLAFGLAAKAIAAPTQTLTLPTFEQTVNGADPWESAQTVLQGTPTLTDALFGTLFTKAPSFFAGTVSVGAGSQSLTGVLFQKAPTFPQGTVTPGAVNLAGTLFQKAPTFPQGAISSVFNLAGALFQKAPTFSQGAITPGAVNLAGVLFAKAPSFPPGTVAQEGGPLLLGGILFQKAPTFPQGSVTTGAVNLAGVLFQKAPTFPQGAVAATYAVTGVLFQQAPSFFAGTLTQDQLLDGVLFQKAPTFFLGTIGVAGELTGILYQNAPVFFTGAVGQVGGSFWRPNPVAFTLNPVAYVPVGPGDLPPWPIEVDGELFENEPLFPVGALS